MLNRNSHVRQRGTSSVEFVLSLLLWLPLLIGTVVIGGELLKSIQVVQLCRDVGHMWAYNVDFSQTSSQNIITQLASGMSFNTDGTGNGVVIFSSLTYVGSAQCTAAGFAANTTACPNLNQTVLTRRVVVGNSGLRTSNFGTPASAIIGSRGVISASNYCTNTTARATNFAALLPLAAGAESSVSEAYFSSPESDWTGFMTSTGEYSYAIF